MYFIIMTIITDARIIEFEYSYCIFAYPCAFIRIYNI